MAKSKNPISYDAPVTLTFVLASIVFFLLNSYVPFLKDNISKWILMSPAKSGDFLFNVKSPLSYFRMIFYVFGAPENPMSFFSSLIFILLLGPAMEERYGSIIIGIMMAISTLFSGVLNTCFCDNSLTGATCIVFMMIFLNAFLSMQKKKIPASFLVVFVLFVFREILEVNPNGPVGIIINICGGLCGSLFAFLASPKVRAAKKQNKTGEGGLLNKAEQAAFLEELDKKSPRFLKKKNKKEKNAEDDDATVVGTLKF